MGIVDDGSVRSDDHQVIRSGRPRNIREIVVAESELAGIGEVGRNVRFKKLLTDGSGGAPQPTLMSVVRIALGRIGRMRHNGTVRAGKGSEVVVEGMILFKEDDDVADRALWWHLRLTHEP